MKDASGYGAVTKLAARKLDQLGSIKAYSGMANTESKLKQMQNQVDLSASIAQIHLQDQAVTVTKKAAATQELLMLVAAAKLKLGANNGDVNKITKKEICALLLGCYGITALESKHLKPALCIMLSEKIAVNPGNIAVSPVAAAPNADPAGVAAAALRAAAPNTDPAGLVAAALEAAPNHADPVAVATAAVAVIRGSTPHST
jgi:hypothetical protein